MQSGPCWTSPQVGHSYLRGSVEITVNHVMSSGVTKDWKPYRNPLTRNELVVTGDRSILGGGVGSQIDEHLIHEAPTPALRRVVSFDDGMTRRMKMLGGVPVR